MGSGEMQGQIWGARARDWADYAEATSTDIFNSVFGLLPIKKGTSLLDIGCGAGAFCQMASERGANVTGFDASAELLKIARERVPHGDFKDGDMEKLPYPDAEFDVITGLNSFQFAENKVNALREARRVAKNGGKVMMLVWGNPDECESTGIMRAIGSLWEAPKATAQPPLFQKGIIESLCEEAGLSADIADEIVCTWNIPDKETVLRGVLSAGLSTLAIRHSGEEKVSNAISEAIAPYRQADGGYKFINKFRYVISTANHVQ
ncbi:MAG TPA: methyltransferase domain-containing protein [Ignavibacteria bacterium]|jgi:SAM-dependent methyltransferase